MPLISLDGIPPTTDAAFAPALAAGTDNPPRRSRNPADSASRSAGTRPAADTKSGSSKTGRIVREGFTYEVPLLVSSDRTSQFRSSLLRRAFSSCATLTPPSRTVGWGSAAVDGGCWHRAVDLRKLVGSSRHRPAAAGRPATFSATCISGLARRSAGRVRDHGATPRTHVRQDWSVEQLPVTLGDDSDLAVDDGDGGLVVDGVARPVERGGPALRVG